MTLTAVDVSYRFGRRDVLADVSFEVGRGVTALLGPNGAGKSTLLEILVGLRRPRTGSVVSSDGRFTSGGGAGCVGYLPQRFSLALSRTATENVAYAAWVHGVDKGSCRRAAERALERVDLTEVSANKVRALSGGQRQRVGIACAIAHDPGVVVFDEPTVGLDPKQRRVMSRDVAAVAEMSAVLLSTHLVEDVQRMATRALVLSEGRLVFDGPVDALGDLSSGEGRSPVERLDDGYAALLDTA